MTTITLDELKNLLHEGKVSFEFIKKDGTNRKTLGTLKEEFIPAEKKPKSESKRKSSNLRFFDLNKNAWRSVYNGTEKITVI
ncbi:MAG: SH3 beta-barrel fold-containing protein [Clostridia bacterium]|jgi:hypothetical protein